MELMNFNNNDSDLRVITDSGEVLFVASDVAKALGHRDAATMVRPLDEDEKGTRQTRTPGGEQDLVVITESGFYHAVMLRQTGRMTDAATKAFVKGFQRWVTHEVLPSIRKHGGYLTPEKVEDFLTDPDTIIQLATNLKEERAARVRAEKAREAISSYAQELEPKADNYDRFISGDGTYSVGTVAKMLGQSQNKLFTLLRNAGVFISKGPMRNTPYQQYMHHFAVKAYDFHRSDDTTGTSYTTRIQPSGVDFVARKLALQVTDMSA